MGYGYLTYSPFEWMQNISYDNVYFLKPCGDPFTLAKASPEFDLLSTQPRY